MTHSPLWREGHGYPYAPMTAPLASSMTWRNQEAATITDQNWGADRLPPGLLFFAPKVAGNDWRIIEQPVSGNFTLVVAWATIVQCYKEYAGGGQLIALDNSTGKFEGYGEVRMPGYYNLANDRFTDVNTYNSSGSLSVSLSSEIHMFSMHRGGPLKWAKLVGDATNLTYYASLNGYAWLQLDQHARNTFCATVDRVGFGLNTYQTDYDAGVLIMHWSLT